LVVFPERHSLRRCRRCVAMRPVNSESAPRIQPRPYLMLAERKHCVKLGTPQSDPIGETKFYPSTSLLPLGLRYNPTAHSDCPFSRAACHAQLHTRGSCDSDTTALRRHSQCRRPKLQRPRLFSSEPTPSAYFE
jgi:hypothetical protein